MLTATHLEDRVKSGPDGTAPATPFGPLPPAVLAYLAHTEGMVGIRPIARLRGCQPSTVLRQIRRIEARRDDPLIDEALDRAAATLSCNPDTRRNPEEWATMIVQAARQTDELLDEVKREARRILRRLCEKDAFLAVAADMKKAVVMRESVPGRHTRTAVVERDIAHRFALNEWIRCDRAGTIARYSITETGRAALKRLLQEEREARGARAPKADVISPFRAQHQEWGERRLMAEDGSGEERVRYNLAESPLTVLGRKRDRDGKPYLDAVLVEAGERLREDFELAQMGPRITQNWAHFLTPADRGTGAGARGPLAGPEGARERVRDAMEALGPGLWDVAFRVCCFLEGLEAAEKRLGWSARSGKVVLRIALQRLAQHYGLSAKPGEGDAG